jgi:hypothetical protein
MKSSHEFVGQLLLQGAWKKRWRPANIVSRLGFLWIMFVAGSNCFSDSADAPSAARKDLPKARVVIAQDPEATEAFLPRPEVVRTIVNRALTNLTDKPTTKQAWLSLVTTQDIVGIKVFSSPGPNSGTRRAVAAAVIEGLMSAGLAPSHIIVWDRQFSDLDKAGFLELSNRFGIRIAGSAQSGYDEGLDEKSRPYENPLLGNLIWGDFEFGRKGDGVGRRSFVSKLVTRQMTKIINLTPLLNHNLAGVSGNLFGLAMGSVDNIIRFENDPEHLATAVPEIYALPALGDRVVLNIVDALICQYEGEEKGLLQYSTALNQIRMSHDPVALDVLSVQELDRQRTATEAARVKWNQELYSNAALLELGVSDLKRIQVDTLQP